MWISKKEIYKISKALEKIASGEDATSLINSMIEENFDTALTGAIGSLDKVSKRQTAFNKTLEAISLGNYQVALYDNHLQNDMASAAIFKMAQTFREIEEITDLISVGDISKKLTKKGDTDKLTDSINKILETFKDAVLQIDRVASGDYEGEILVKSQQDILGSALQKMIKNLKELKNYTTRQDWIKSNLNRLSENISGDKEQLVVANEALTYIAHTCDAGTGALYLNNENKFFLASTFAFTKKDALANIYRLGEGIVGQVALERKPILLKNITRDEMVIESATISQAPLSAYTFPLVYEDELFGIVELASFELFNDTKIEFLNESGKIFASYLFAAKQREETRRLLRDSKEANIKLLLQSEEIQQTNAQLEEQQQLLTQQSEELQQTNAQLEELQQQLQQQLEEMRISNDDLVRSRFEIDERNKKLEEANTYKSQFLANVSHELRTPLNSIILLSKMVALNEEKRLSDEEVKKISLIYESGNELLRLINDILDLSKAESKSVSINITKFHSGEILNHIKDMFIHLIEHKGLHFDFSDEYNDFISTDKEKLYQILRNIISNAIKFTKKGNIFIKFSKTDDENKPMNVIIKDSGIGIPKDKLELIFEPFKQVDGSISREFGGTGLGLAIAREFSKKLGIEIKVESELGKGTVFELCLPKSISTAAQTGSATLRQNLPLNNYLLVMGKNSVLSDSISSLNHKEHLNTIMLNSIDEAKELFKSQVPLGVIIDTNESGGISSDIIKELKSIKELQAIPLYAISEKDKENGNWRLDGYKCFLNDNIINAKKISIAIYPAVKNEILKIITAEGFDVKVYGQIEQLKLALDNHLVDKVIITSPKELSAYAKELKERNMGIELIALLDAALSEQSENTIKEFVEAVIVESQMSEDRLINELKRVQTKQSLDSKIIHAQKNLVADVSLRGKKILIADDDVKNIYVLSSVMESKGAKVIQAFDGKKAVELLEKDGADLVLMDIMMPVMNGYEAIEAIRKQERFKNLPIIAVTAKALQEDHRKSIEAGANDYITKPVDYNAIVSLVDAWIRKTAK